MLRRAAIALCIFYSFLAFAQPPSCTPEDAQRADKAVDGLNSWDRIHDWYKSFRRCDDGGLAEGVSEAVARNLIERWETLPRLGQLINDPGFRQFVLKHVDQTLDEDEIKKIDVNSEKRCPTNLHPFCLELKKRAESH